ncbi:DUF2059 domain-containing protein [Jiella mangrovi]|uniref:DUF2059 domain-containing protein n=1 Tax=Jiella mangrovi TaxID=2821407 RepID=A0ABS4BGL9_9HYPH|nr:DUF2059 domain-containing protein [Jiella mangrovi]MBP0615900.1 DUF2059 domain-containing protein [Jiella mangrovi]
MIFSQSMRRGILAAATALILVPAAAVAQEPAAQTPAGQDAADENISESHLNAARAAITAIHATDQFDEILPNAATQIKSELIANRPDMDAKISDMVDDAALKLASRRADLETEIARIYARMFTEDELKSIASFYTSEPGKKLLEQGPQATRSMLRAAEVWSRGIVRDLRQTAFDGFREMNGGEAPAADGSAGGQN